MAAVSRLKPFVKSVATKFDIRSTFAQTSKCYSSAEIKISRVLGSHYKSNSVNVLTGSTRVSFAGIVNCRLLSSSSGSVSNAAKCSDISAVGNTQEAERCSTVQKIALKIEGLYKLSQISEDVNNMLRVHPNVLLERELPYCFWFRIEELNLRSMVHVAELTILYNLNLKSMSMSMSMSMEATYKEEILMLIAGIIKKHGARLVWLCFDASIQGK